MATKRGAEMKMQKYNENRKWKNGVKLPWHNNNNNGKCVNQFML